MKVSVVCCYNDEKQYENMVSSLSIQTLEHELIGIDNRDNHFRSAASALNYGGNLAIGDILVFLHQDILFDYAESLSLFVDAISVDKESIIGLYGASHGKSEPIGKNLFRVETLDECCIAMKKSTWMKYRFNDLVCNSWHLYAVELCLRASEDEVLIVTGQFPITHLSMGAVDECYMKTYKQLLMKYKNHGWISTTCKSMPTNMIYYYAYYWAWKMKKILLGNFPLVGIIKGKIKGK